MKPIRLYIENFMCHDKSYVDFTQFSSALIVGKIENNDLYSNGVGKTTIFKAMEYVLFNQADVNLEKIVRDDTNLCRIVIDFMIDSQEYRLSRSRTKKGSTDVTLLQRNNQDGSIEEIYHAISTITNELIPFIDKKDTLKYWKDLSGSRASDTEKDLAKLIKINHKSFRSTVLFPQNDMTGLSTATATNRKTILKEALNLLVYTKLEKMAKEKFNALSKEYDKNKILIDNLGNPHDELLVLSKQLDTVEKTLSEKHSNLDQLNEKVFQYNEKINELNNAHTNLETKFASLLTQEQSILSHKSKLEISVKEYQSKKTNVTKTAKELVEEIKSLKENQLKLVGMDYSQIDILSEKIINLQKDVAHHNINIQNSTSKYEELKIPMPDDNMCKHCRQPMTEKHRKECRAQIVKDMDNFQKEIKNSKQQIVLLNNEILNYQRNINSLNLSKQQIENVNTQITVKEKEIQDKKSLHDEYFSLLNKFINELSDKNNELDLIKIELKNSSLEEANVIKTQILQEKQKITDLTVSLNILNKEITHFNSNKTIILHTIDQKKNDKLKKENLQKVISGLENQIKTFPLVLQAFSSTGIPNLIIQNVLDDLQIEANTLLTQLKPGLQLSFFVEKTQGDGTEADTLDISYHINGKERYYEQLSGAMKIAVIFSLKLGLSFLLQKMIGTNIKFLLLDEIDQSLDKASVDAFADIVKFFQKDFTILVITHNDRLKDKFSHAILVEQDINMISRARVVSSW